VALGKATRVFDVPVVLTTVETKSFSGNMWPQLRAVFPGRNHRAFVHELLGRQKLRRRNRKSGRKKILIAGLWTEVCVAFPTVQAIHDGYEIYVVEDCCGDVSQLAHDNAMKRVIQAGAKPVTSMQVMLECSVTGSQGNLRCGDGHREEPYGAYGIGVEYAYTMVHGARPRNSPSTRSRLPLQLTSKPEGRSLFRRSQSICTNSKGRLLFLLSSYCTTPRSPRTGCVICGSDRRIGRKEAAVGHDDEILRLAARHASN